MPIEIDDLSGIESWSASNLPIPVGKHLCEIVDAREEPASTGSPQVILEWSVVPGMYQGRTSREWLVILPQTYGKVKALLEAVGWQLAPGKFVMPVAQLVGRRAVITIGEEPFKGKMTTRVIGHEPADTPVPMNQIPSAEAVEPDDAADLPF